MHREDAFTVLFRANVAAVRGYARTIVFESDVENVVAATFATAWQKFESIPTEWPRAWLFGVARNHARNTFRSHRRRVALVDAITDLRPVESVESDGLAIETLRGALAALKEEDREILQLATWHNLSSTEIAEVLSIRPEAARVRLHRARQRLVALLDGDEGVLS